MASRRVSCGANFFNIDWQTFRPRRAPCLRCRPVPFRNRRSGPDVQPMRCGVADKYKLGPIAMAAWADAVYWEGVAGHGPEPAANWSVQAGRCGPRRRASGAQRWSGQPMQDGPASASTPRGCLARTLRVLSRLPAPSSVLPCGPPGVPGRLPGSFSGRAPQSGRVAPSARLGLLPAKAWWPAPPAAAATPPERGPPAGRPPRWPGRLLDAAATAGAAAFGGGGHQACLGHLIPSPAAYEEGGCGQPLSISIVFLQ